jgi:hypothetical protein
MNCWGIRIYFTKSRFSLNGGSLFIWSYCQDMKKSSLNAGTLNRGFTVYRKPTTTDPTIILSTLPMEHKLVAYRYYLTRMNSLPLSKLHKQKEWNTIQYIAKTNNFPSKAIDYSKTKPIYTTKSEHPHSTEFYSKKTQITCMNMEVLITICSYSNK